MDERYEIRGKIGQGGIGAVYRAFDQRMNREVAIKRIIPEGGDADHQDEATRQLTKEAGALAALQHPHIVTVYDVGADEDGPYVVMEMLTGKTLDELVEKAPLTASDFREVAIQTQEALIAAQDLHIVHRDIKPGNIMLTWLPSGKFQVKIVDFGLAKFTPKPSKQTLDQGDSVYGSIFFMAPEQFERGIVDGRSDLYAMGCVYYFALTGKYPFDGETGPQVMGAHLGHLVKLIGEVRPDLPHWLRDWVMWHINRQPDDRPADARESLQVFLRNDGANIAIPAPPPAPARPAPPMRPGTHAAATQAPASATQSMPQSLQPPEGSKPSVHTTSHVLTMATGSPTASMAAPTVGPPGSRPTATGQIRHSGPATRPGAAYVRPKKKPVSIATKLAISGILAAAAIAVGMVAMNRSKEERKRKEFEELVTRASDPNLKELKLTPKELKSLLDSLKIPQPLNLYSPAMRALRLGTSEVPDDVDNAVADIGTGTELQSDTRQMLFRDVIRRRTGHAGVPKLIEFARTTKETGSAEAALDAIRDVLTDADFPTILDTVESAPTSQVRKAAADDAMDIIRRTKNKERLVPLIEQALGRAKNDDVRSLLYAIKTTE